jgi:SPP1 family predicted phage head-tail adaptor
MATLSAGSMPDRVTVQSVTNVSDGYGGWTSTWAPIAGPSSGVLWAKVEQVEGGEQTTGGQTLERYVYEVTIRKRAAGNVTAAMRVVWKGKTLSVFEIVDAHNDRSRWVLRCTQEPTA